MKTVKLKFPINSKGRQIDSLTVRRPKIQDRLAVEHIQGSDILKEVALLANLCEIDHDEISQLDLVDYSALQEVLNDFLS